MTSYGNDFLESGDWTPVSSSNVAEAMYNAEREVLSIRFHDSSATYHYSGVSKSMAQGFISASSHGTWVWDNLRRPRWPFTPG